MPPLPPLALRLLSFTAVLFIGSASAGAQQLGTSLSNYNPDGQIVTIPIRVNCSAGATAVNSLSVFLKADPASDAITTISVNPVSREVQLVHEGMWTMWPLPTLSPGAAAVTWGALGKIEIVGYSFVDPATSGNEFRLDLTLKRYTPYTGLLHFTLGAAALVGGSTVYSQPWSWVSAGTWNYAPSQPPSWTISPTSVALAAGGVTSRADISGTPAAVPVVTPSASWLQVVGTSALSGFAFRVDPNPTGVSRSAHFSVSDGPGAPRTVAISQAAAVSQAPVTSLAAYNPDGQTITIPIRVSSANGASALSSLNVYLKTDPAANPLSIISIDLVNRNLQVTHENNWTMWPLPSLSPGSANVTWGALGKFEVIGYNFIDPATSGNELRLDLTLKRYSPYTGPLHFTLAAIDPLAGSAQYSAPWMWVSMGTWTYSPASSGDFTFSAPSAANVGYNQPGSLTATLTATGSPPGVISLSANQNGVTFSPGNSVNLTDSTPRTVSVNLPPRLSSYTFSLGAAGGTGPSKTQVVNVTVAPPAVSLTAGGVGAIYAGSMATVPLQITSPTFSGTVALYCSSSTGISCASGQTVPIVAGTTAAYVLSLSSSPTAPIGATVTITAALQGLGLPAPSASATVSVPLLPGFTLQTLPSLSALQGNNVGGPIVNTLDVTVTPSAGFTGVINFSCPAPTTVTCTGTATITGSVPVHARVSLNVTGLTATSSSSPLTLRGTAAAVTRETSSALTAYLTGVATILDPSPGFGTDPFTGLPRRGKIAREDNAPVPAPVKFSWSPGLNATGYRIQIDTNPSPGPSTGATYDETTNNLFSSPIPVRPSPSTLYSVGVSWRVTITSYHGTTSLGTSTQVYELVPPIAPPTNFTPAAGTTLTTNQTFTWLTPITGGTPPSQYRLLVGRLGPGSSDVFASSPVTANVVVGNSITAVGLPSGYPLFVTLESNFPALGGWQLAQNFLYAGATSSGSGGATVAPGTISAVGPDVVSNVSAGASVVVNFEVSSSDGFIGGVSATCTTSSGLRCANATTSVGSSQPTTSFPVAIMADAAAAPSPGTKITVSFRRLDNSATVTADATVSVGPPAAMSVSADAVVPRIVSLYTDGQAETITVNPILDPAFPAALTSCSTTYNGRWRTDIGIEIVNAPDLKTATLTLSANQFTITGRRGLVCFGPGFQAPVQNTILNVYDATPIITRIWDSSRRPNMINESSGSVRAWIEGRNLGRFSPPGLGFDPPLAYVPVAFSPGLVIVDLFAPKAGNYSVTATSSGNNPLGSGLLSAPDSTRSSGTSFPANLAVLPTSNANAPVLTSIAEDFAYRGQTGRVYLSGLNLGAATSILVDNGAGITLVLYRRAEDSIEVSFEIDATAVAGDRQIRVSNGFQTSNSLTWRIGDPTPIISNISPSDWIKGQTTSVVIYGSGFGSNPILDAGPGITFSSVTALSESEISVQVTVAPNATPDDRTVTLTSQGPTGNGFQPVTGSQPRSTASSRLITVGEVVLALTVVEKGGAARTAQPNDTIFIDGFPPAMPELTARLINADPTAQVTWRLEVVEDYYRRAANPGRRELVRLRSCYPTIGGDRSCPANSLTTASSASWPIDWGVVANRLRGGSATLFWSYQGVQRSFEFRIGGRNPARAEVLNALGYQGPGLDYAPYWFTGALLLSESGAAQFDSRFQPTYGPPAGYGLMQIDRDVGFSTTPAERWDFTMNVKSAITLIGEKEAVERSRYPPREVIRDAWNRANPRSQVGFPPSEPAYYVSKSNVTTTYPECTFSAGTGTDWWDNVGSGAPNAATEFRSWLSGSILNAYIGGPFFLKIISGAPGIPPIWVTTQAFPHAGNPRFSKIGAVCAFVKSARN